MSKGLFGKSKPQLAGYYNYINYLNGVDTSAVDNTIDNMSESAFDLSQQLGNRPDYVYSVDGSDAARQRMENAVYNSAMQKMTPQFERQQKDLETKLQNQGLTVGSEAYQTAMKDMMEEQNNAVQQAAYQSVMQGQQAFSNSLLDSIKAGNFTNQARQYPINEILSLLSNSVSGYDVAKDKFVAETGRDSVISQNKQNNFNNMWKGINNVGNVGMGIASLFSDERLKENLQVVGKLDNGLKVYVFNFKGSNTKQIGLLAQEVQKLHPEAVSKDENDFLMVDYALAVK